MMKNKTGFEKFMSKEMKGAAKKEQLRQDKRQWKKDQQEKRKNRNIEHGTRNVEHGTRNVERGTGVSGGGRAKTGGKNIQQARPDGPVGRGTRNIQHGTSLSAVAKAKAGNVQHETRKPDEARGKVGGKIIVERKGGPVKIETRAAKQVPQMPLNKYIAHAGVCSRRDAVNVIKGGKVKVNGQLILEPGHKVSENDEVKLAGRKIYPVKGFVYILLNKPKDYLTTTDDPQQRKTVLDLIRQATPERVYPVGRLDRNTSGVLLLTNDGDLSQKLTHPSNEIRKLYAVTLDKPLTRHHFDEILKGVPLEDGIAHVDSLAFTDAKDHTQLGIELHSGRNRIVRRIFEHYGYDVKNLDRVVFAGLTKKNVQRGKWRYLSEKEVRDLKFFGKGKK